MTKLAKPALLTAILALAPSLSPRPDPLRHGNQRHHQQARRRRRSHPDQPHQRHGSRRHHQSRLRRQVQLHTQRQQSRRGPHLIRAVHQGVTYHQIAPPGTNSVEVKVYDVAKKVSALSLTADVIRFQADATSLQGMRLFAVDNTSSPPVSQMNDHNFEFYLPAGAKVEQMRGARAQRPAHHRRGRAPSGKEPLRRQLPAASRRNAVSA